VVAVAKALTFVEDIFIEYVVDEMVGQMPRRDYRMDKRAEQAQVTRRRIVEACFALHGR